jgi:hypothetical protein
VHVAMMNFAILEMRQNGIGGAIVQIKDVKIMKVMESSKKIRIGLKQMKKIKIKEKRKLPACPICEQEMDLCVTCHKTKPYIDNKMYSQICFGCYSVPKILDQKYDEKGYIKEEIDMEYCRKNLHTPEELYFMGSVSSLEEAKKCVRGVKRLEINKDSKIKNKTKPKLEFYNLD